MKIIYKIISDLHFGKKDFADDFYMPFLQKTRKLIVLLQSDCVIVINGDFTDGLETPFKNILFSYWEVFEVLKNRIRQGKKTIFIRGNHDSDKDFPFPYVDTFRIGNYVFLHGHQFDVFNSKWKWIGSTITKIGAFLERLGWKNVDILFQKLGRGRHGTNLDYFGKIERWVDKHPEYNGGTIVFGHTHELQSEPVQLRNCKVMNCGTWCGEHMDILELECDD